MSLLSISVYVKLLPQISLACWHISKKQCQSSLAAITWQPADHLSTCVDDFPSYLVALWILIPNNPVWVLFSSKS